MSKVLTLELNDDVYKVLQQQATAVGVSVAELVATSLNRQYSLLVSPQSDSEEARQRLLGYAGVISLGYATGTDNEGIDTDLAKAYDNNL
ncbi:MAG: hypothetical protein ACKO3K_04290 [Cuspidothrix sp.]